MLHYKALLILWVGLSFGISGCGSSDEHTVDEHLEHFVPAHKPIDYAALVEQLEKRIAQQSSSSGAGEGVPAAEQFATARQELIDIIGWIPELAADSELQKKEFETAVVAGRKLNLALGFEKPSEGTKAVDAESIPKLLDELKALVSKSQISMEPM